MLVLPQLQPARAARHRDQVVEAVAAVDVQALRDGAEPVRRIQVAVALRGMGAAPQPLTVGGELHRAQVVVVAALGVEQLPEQALPHQVEHQHLAPIVAAVLHHHAVLALPLGRLDQSPAIVHRVRRGHLRRRVLPVAHGLEAHRHVPFPRRRREHQVELLLGDHAHEVARAPVVDDRARPAGGDHLVGVDGGVLRGDVADGFHVHAVEREEVLDVHRTLPADSDEADAHPVQRRRGEQRRLLPGLRRQRRRGRPERGRRAQIHEFPAARLVRGRGGTAMGHRNLRRSAGAAHSECTAVTPPASWPRCGSVGSASPTNGG